MRKSIIILSILLILVVITCASVGYLWSKYQSNYQSNNVYGPSEQLTQRAILKISASITGNYWSRDNSTDLPICTSNIAYSISDVGNVDATNVAVTTTLNGFPYGNEMIPSVTTYDHNTYHFSVSTSYDKTSSVQIQASCRDSTDSYTLAIDSTFPRSWYVEGASPTVELFITPKEQNLVAMKNSILKNKFILDFDWIALRSWVGNNVNYNQAEVESNTVHWQFPKETLQSRNGVCIDYSILLCSLYRAGVFGPNDVYVVVGMNGQSGHAWVKVRLPIVGWYTLEPQVNGPGYVAILGDLLSVSGYDAVYEFNDQQFHMVR